MRYIGTLSYLGFISVLNYLFVNVPMVHIGDITLSPLDPVVGLIYVMRDFAQREIGHYVLLVMALAGYISYITAGEAVAVASLSAFIIGEGTDWAIFSFTKKPLSKRILWSSVISSPFDSLVFLHFLNQLNLAEWALMTVGKIGGAVLLWWLWRRRAAKNE